MKVPASLYPTLLFLYFEVPDFHREGNSVLMHHEKSTLQHGFGNINTSFVSSFKRCLFRGENNIFVKKEYHKRQIVEMTEQNNFSGLLHLKDSVHLFRSTNRYGSMKPKYS